MDFPNTRDGSLGRLDAFLAVAPLYARDRNFVRPGHPAVSLLSPALRHRLITEREVAAAAIAAHGFGRVEKFVQEVYWRRYWKAWLSHRPQVWREAVAGTPGDDAVAALAGEVMRAASGNAVIDHFARELLDTGYLHNHARMWFAAWWVHQAGLPWEWGAAFFMRHLLDGDPASNTLSWRWVAGLQTPGKTYLARSSNIEKYLDSGILENIRHGLSAFDNPQPRLPGDLTRPPVTRPQLPARPLPACGRMGIWIHEEDLLAEQSPLGAYRPQAIVITGHPAAWARHGYADRRIRWIGGALDDAAKRAAYHWSANPHREDPAELAAGLLAWARRQRLDAILTLRPEVGPLDDDLPHIAQTLETAGIALALADRTEDLGTRTLASGGFFPFWEKLRPVLLEQHDDAGTR
jgi:deoxyribodipyrimidine photo-lyase